MKEFDIVEILKSQSETLKILDKYVIQIGVISGTDESQRKDTLDVGLTNADLLFIHENGSPANNIPARPVLDITLRHFIKKELDKEFDYVVEGILSKGWQEKEVERELKKFCSRMEQFARAGIRRKSLGLAPNSPRTIENKGSDVPLLDTGQLSRSITCKLIKL